MRSAAEARKPETGTTAFGAHLREVEDARQEHARPSFGVTLFDGTPDFSLLFPFPAQAEEDRIAGDTFCDTISEFLRAEVNPDEIEREGRIPPSVLDRLFALGALGMKVSRDYGGLEMSQTNYSRVLALVSSWCNALALTLSAHQSIGVSQPLLVVTEGQLGRSLSSEGRKRNAAQRAEYLPRVATNVISAFALTEPSVGSDPAGMAIEAIPSDDGTHYVVNGEKLWCTNGPIARFVVLMARVPCRRMTDESGTVFFYPAPGGIGATDRPITSFIVDMETPGIEVVNRCEFEGCRGIENAHLRFTKVMIPAENVIGDVGQGLKYALSILNHGRVAIAAICLGMAKQAWLPTLDWARTRTTFGRPLGEHEAQTARIGHMASSLFAMEAVTWLSARLIDQAATDVRIEAAIAKIFCSEGTIHFLKDVQILWGGRGYETAASKRKRGEPGFPIEQLVRDAELYRIGEGATDILVPFVAREAWSPHLARVKGGLGGRFLGFSSGGDATRAFAHYAKWYLDRLNPLIPSANLGRGRVGRRLAYVARRSRGLARASLRAMAMYRAGLERKQLVVDRLAAEGMDLFLVCATTSYAAYLAEARGRREAWELADHFFGDAQCWIAHRNFRYASRMTECEGDEGTLSIGRKALAGAYDWLADGAMARDYSSSFVSGP